MATVCQTTEGGTLDPCYLKGWLAISCPAIAFFTLSSTTPKIKRTNLISSINYFLRASVSTADLPLRFASIQRFKVYPIMETKETEEMSHITASLIR